MTDSGVMDGGEVIVVSGPPGVGKSTVARAIVDRLDRAVLVRGDDVLGAVVRGFIEPWQSESAAQNRAAIAATAAMAGAYADGSFPVVVDAVLGPWQLDTFLAVIDRPVRYVVLRPPLDVTIARAVDRGPGALTDTEPVAFMWEQFAELGEYEQYAIDTGSLEVEATVDVVIDRRRKHIVGPPQR